MNAESVEATMADILRLLDAMEFIATGINSGTFDRDVLHSLTATSFVQGFRKYRPVIDMLRERQGNPNLYLEYEHASSDMARMNPRRLR